jgi:hypothetical protein
MSLNKFEIDVSGNDLLSKDYVICLANNKGIIRGFKFNERLVNILKSKYGQGIYTKYKKSHKGLALFKIRLYSIAIYKLIASIPTTIDLQLKLCRDFDGREIDIKNNLNYFLEKKLDCQDPIISFNKLDKDSNAHRYSYLMRKDIKNKMQTYIKIELNEFEKFLIK